MKHLINTTVLMIGSSWSISDAMRAMLSRRVSSALVFDHSDLIVGIVTERDILRKFASIKSGDPTVMAISEIMSTPVEFVELSTLNQDVKRLHQIYQFRHFPVKRNKLPATLKNIVGIITMTDIANRFLDESIELIKDGFQNEPEHFEPLNRAIP